MVLTGMTPVARPAQIAQAMADRMIHRGPDSSGVWENIIGDIAFGHRRLAIVDLTASGHQPMTSANGRWTMTYNGELYNAIAVRDRLGIPAATLRGHSDTEILIEAIAKVGVDRVLDEAIGMFAFAAFDRDRDELWIARDRFGEKPLYYTVNKGAFAFASELRALRALPGFDPIVDRSSVVELFERSMIRAPHTIFEGVSKLEAGAVARISRDGSIHWRRYYDATAIARTVVARTRSDSDAIDEFEELLGGIVKERTISDVPLGAFLSGGIDSSVIVAMMQRSGAEQARTYTMGFEVDDLNEAPAARIIANALGTDHHEWIVTGNDALGIVPDLGALYDEPFADSSQIPTILVSRFARTEVTVALSGDGGDELFGGYERYGHFERIVRLHRAPRPVRAAGAAVLGVLSEETLDRLGTGGRARLLPKALRKRTGRRTHNLAAMLRAPDDVVLYDLIMRLHDKGPQFVPGGRRRPFNGLSLFGAMSPVELGMAIDTVDYLPNDILTKVDRASMSTSLEVRAPMLDHRLHEFAWSLTPDQRTRNGVGKWIVREALRRHVPDVADLPKRGFGAPVDAWLRGPLHSWADQMLDPNVIRSAGLLDVDSIRTLWLRHQSGAADLGAELWPILMFQAWSESWY